MRKKLHRFLLLTAALFGARPSLFASTSYYSDGSVNYSYGMDALAAMTTEVVVAMTYVTGLVLTASCLFAYYNITVLTYKIQHGENGVIKAILQLFLSLVFIVVAVVLLPKMFGYNATTGGFGGF